MSTEEFEKMINWLKLEYKAGKKLMCPRCGWLKGHGFHCSLCEGKEENIVNWYRSITKY